MTLAKELPTLAAQAGGSWSAGEGWSDAAITKFEAAAGQVLPAELRTFLAEAAGSSLAGESPVDVFDGDLVWDVADQEGATPTGAIAFASDGGSDHFAFVTDAALGVPAGSVIAVSRGAPDAANCRFLAPDLRSFFALCLHSSDLHTRPTLEEAWSAAHAQEWGRFAGPGLHAFTADDARIDQLHWRTLVPKELSFVADTVLQGWPLKGNQRVHLDEHGRVVFGYLFDQFDAGGVRCQANSWLSWAGHGMPRRFTPALPLRLEGFPVAAGGEVTLPGGGLDQLCFSLGENYRIDGILCAIGGHVRLDAARHLLQGVLAADAKLGEMALPAGTRFELRGGQTASLFTARLPTPWVWGGTEYSAGTTLYFGQNGDVVSTRGN